MAASSVAGCRSLTEFARSCVFHATDDPLPGQVETLLGELAAVMGKLKQSLPKE
jgi:hypothetical protein